MPETKPTLACPVCDGLLVPVDVPDFNLFRCGTCSELVQDLGPRPGGGSVLSPIGQFLKRNMLGDDRARAAISSPQVNSVRGFLDSFEASERMFNLNTAETKGMLRELLTQLENRLDFALAKLAGLDLADDRVGDAMDAIREARQFASPHVGRRRGPAGE